jgi:hypothetical protein
MNEIIYKYFSENKDNYPLPVLAEQLTKSGYAQTEIQEVLDYLKRESSVLTRSTSSYDFWNFKTKLIYQKSSQKWKDFLFGFFSSRIFFWVLAFVLNMSLGRYYFEYGISASVIFYQVVNLIVVAAFIYFFRKRKLIIWGIAVNFILGFLGNFLGMFSLYF